MNEKTLLWAAYWRNSLADTSLGQGAFRTNETKQLHKLDAEILEKGSLDSDLTEKLFDGIDEKILTIFVAFRPLVFIYRVERGTEKNDNSPSSITPLLCFATLSRSGRLYPSSTPVVPRDILEPLEAKTYSIGSVEDLDIFLSKESFTELLHSDDQLEQDENNIGTAHGRYWVEYKSYCETLLNAVAGEWLSDLHGYLKTDYGFILRVDQLQGAAQHILNLYDHLRRTNPCASLLDTYACDKIASLKQTLSDNSLVAERLAHASDRYGLATAQRDALSHILSVKDGQMIAVNGPPGTGKTTLVLSLVATLWTKAAIAGDNPPVIIAASANNQATSNVIDAFGKDFSEGSNSLAGRWLPDVTSYGAYFPSKDEEGKSGKKYQTENFFKKIENKAYLERAELYYKEKAQRFYNSEKSISVSHVVEKLRKTLISLSKQLSRVEPVWEAYSSALEDYTEILGDDPDEKVVTLDKDMEECSTAIINIRQAQTDWLKYLSNESIWYALLSWLPPVRKKRERLAQLFVKDNFGALYDEDNVIEIDKIEEELVSFFKKEKKVMLSYEKTKEKYNTAINKLANCKDVWVSIVNAFGLSNSDNVTLSDLDTFLDATVRFKMFRLTVHYWEGRWLIDVRERLEEVEKHRANGLKIKQRRWQRRMMVTPCIVSTLYMLPFHMSGTRREDDGNFLTEYNYNFIDLLIVDEGGLIPPELAGASLSLAKRAVVIGDTRQIEPIQSLSSQVDIGNLHQIGLLPHDNIQDHYCHLKDMGKTVFGGSVMKSAQMLSHYHYDKYMERGMYLYEHRRCHKEIIDFCNELCYDEKLIHKREDLPNNEALPTVGHLHIDGMCQKAIGGSRYNELEAQTIAKWLADNRQQLESKYDKKSLSDIVCIITPFGSQTNVISQACRNNGIKVGKNKDEMVVGTVHAIQGAERPVVIFSPVYSKHADGHFIDRSNSMLNVAVSRAKDHFLVFGDMDVFTSHQDEVSPRGLLTKYLFRSSKNIIEYPALPRRDLVTSHAVTPLYNVEEHDQFLVHAINQALDEIHIVTPWIRQDFLNESIVLRSMSEAHMRKVAIRIYTDFELNCHADTYDEIKTKRRQLLSLIEWLKDYGIHLILVKRVHSKVVMIDSNLLCVGSFNWFSASRRGQYVRHETSLVYKSARVKREIEILKKSLNQRTVELGVAGL